MTYSHVLLGINTNGKKGMGGQRVTLSLAQISARKSVFSHVVSIYANLLKQMEAFA